MIRIKGGGGGWSDSWVGLGFGRTVGLGVWAFTVSKQYGVDFEMLLIFMIIVFILILL